MEHDEALDYFDYCGHQHDEDGEHQHEEDEHYSETPNDEGSQDAKDINSDPKANESIDSIPTIDSGYAVVDTGNYDEVPQSVRSYTSQMQQQNWQVNLFYNNMIFSSLLRGRCRSRKHFGWAT